MNNLNKEEYKKAKKKFDDEGFIVFENLISSNEVEEYLNALDPYLKKNIKGRNNFEGLKTNRIYGLLDKSEIFGKMVTNSVVMQFVRDELGESALLSALLAINLMPGETVQPWHTDDGYVHVEMPHPSFGISAFWALTDTNKENGATELLPGSHKWDKSKLAKYIKLDDYQSEGFWVTIYLKLQRMKKKLLNFQLDHYSSQKEHSYTEEELIILMLLDL